MSDLGRVESNLPEEVVRQDEGAQVLEAVVPPVRTDTAGGRPHRVPAHFPAQHSAPAVIVGKPFCIVQLWLTRTTVVDPDPYPKPDSMGYRYLDLIRIQKGKNDPQKFSAVFFSLIFGHQNPGFGLDPDPYPDSLEMLDADPQH